MRDKPAIPPPRSVAVTLAAIAALMLTACGGSGQTADQSQSAPLTQSAGRESGGYIVPSRDRVSTSGAPSVARHPAGQAEDETSDTGAKPFDPCRLVPLREAAAILGEQVHLSVGMQGPTCIYAGRASKNEVTLVVERAELGVLRRHAARSSRKRVAGRTAWCIRYGSSSLAVPLNDGSVLSVTAPCAVAARFAARALGRLG